MPKAAIFTRLALPLACLTLSSVALADNSVKLYGLLDVYVGAQKNLGRQTAFVENSNGMTTSYFGFGGREDLGSGYAAVFALEAFLRPSNGAAGRSATDSFFGRNAYAGIESPAGTVLLGRNTLPYYVTALSFNPFGNSFGFSPVLNQMYKGVNGQGILGDTNWNNSVMIVSPQIQGFTGTAIYASGNQAGNAGANQIGADLKYARGKFAAALSYQHVKYSSTPGDLQTIIPGFSSQAAYLAAASYDFSAVKLSALYQRVENNIDSGNQNSDSGQLGVAVPIGNGVAMGSIMYTKSHGRGDPIRATWSLGYDYRLSKRTDAYVAYMNDHASGLSSGYTVGTGLRTRF